MKKIKILAIISLIVASLIIFAGCTSCTSSPELEERQNSSNNYFITIQDCTGYDIVYDPNTKVMYNKSYKGVVTMLVNVDGNPLLYNK